MGGRSSARLGPAWTERGRAPAGHFTRAPWPRKGPCRLSWWDARRGTLAGDGQDEERPSRTPRRSGCATSSTTANVKPSHAPRLPPHGPRRAGPRPSAQAALEQITTDTIELLVGDARACQCSEPHDAEVPDRKAHGIFKRAMSRSSGCRPNPMITGGAPPGCGTHSEIEVSLPRRRSARSFGPQSTELVRHGVPGREPSQACVWASCWRCGGGEVDFAARDDPRGSAASPSDGESSPQVGQGPLGADGQRGRPPRSRA